MTRIVKSRLQGFIPKLKAANDSLPEDSSTLDIEHVTKEGPYIEMDLGLGVLEERDDDDDSSGQSEVMENFLSGNNSTSTKPSIIEMQDASSLPESPLLCDEALKHHRAACPSGSLQQLDIVLSLMSRILIQLRKPHTTVESITKINVIQEDMYKLMRRRDLLLKPSDAKPTHESIYQDELDTLLNA